MSQPKIDLVGYILNKGGAERVMANLSNFFHADNLRFSFLFNIDRICYRYRNIEPFKL